MGTPRVGLLIQKFDGLYQSELLRGLREEGRALGVHLLCFPGSELGSERPFWREFNVSFQLARRVRLDGLVSITNSYIWYLPDAEQAQFFASLGEVPVVSVGRAGHGVAEVRPDNRMGMAELVDHFIHDHGFRRIAFVAGPAHNADAHERLEVFRERHAAAGIPVDESLIVAGDFYGVAARAATRRLLAEQGLPEAIIAANDEMGFAVLATLHEHGVWVPRQVAVGGFDDLAALLADGPPLTSVRQDVAGQAALALRLLVAQLRGGPPVPADTVVPTRLMARYSCGCSGLHAGERGQQWESPTTAQTELQDLRTALAAEVAGERGRLQDVLGDALRRALANGRSLHDLQAMVQVLQAERAAADRAAARPPDALSDALNALPLWLVAQERLLGADAVLERVFPSWLISRILVTRMSSREFSLAGMTRFLADGLSSLGVRNAYLALYPRVGAVLRWDDCDIAEEAQLVLAIRDGEVLSTAEFERFPVAELLPMPVFHQPEHAAYGFLPLFQQREHYGYLILDVSRDYPVTVEQLREAISNLISSVMVVGELDRARDLLRRDLDQAHASNEQLAALAEHDVLTGLLNRRGFLGRIEVLRGERQGSLLLISVDMDGLKQINDRLGHAAGDEAICAMAQVLRASFRPGDLIARFGGDEFAVLATAGGADVEARLRARLETKLAAFNAENKAAWRLSASLGMVSIPALDRRPLDEHLATADRLMYAEKRQRKFVASEAAAPDASA
ncbi:GGDEF domain-containing protein [Niveibacterium sp. SC-1]|uniref:GGDEF domain-containing protein n=1 Tax=Niveibacterium sp. SC-1 TaxID=3135646 RepID=UPI0031200E5C